MERTRSQARIFVVEGRQREHAWVRGRYEDIVRMGLLRSEWRERRGTT
ncbi:MAG: hypothetical protein JST33_14930 [Actinobacteria bacterium]|nr:hypothetical protein [Actinomycetota bacterium]